MIKRLLPNIFTKKIKIAKWQLNLFGVLILFSGIIIGFYLTVSNIIIPTIFADTASSTAKDTDTDFNQGTIVGTEVSGSGSSAYVKLDDTSGPDQTTYRRSITIDNTGNSNTLTEYQVLIDAFDTATLISGGKMQSDCDDLRFTNDSGTELDYFIVGATCNTADTEIWVQVDSIAASSNVTIYIYYGAPAASAGQDESATFDYSTEKTVGYVLDSTVNDLQIISLENGNSVTHNGVTRSLDQYDTSSFSSISQWSPITATKFFNADDSSDDTDSLVPLSWAGTEFLMLTRSAANETFFAIAPWQDATVDIYSNGALICGSQSVTSAGATLNCTSNAFGQIRVASDYPILVFYEKGAADPMPLHPSSASKWIGSGANMYIMSGSGGADYRYFSSASGSETDPADIGAGAYVGLGGSSFGRSPAIFAYSTNNPIGFQQYADSDGGDAHTFQLVRDMGTTYGSAVTTDYISIASDQSFSCTVYNTSGGTIASGSGSSSNSSIYFLGFGTGDSSVLTADPWYMICDKPVSAHYQKGASSEATLWSHPMMRQYSYPEPSSSVGSEVSALPLSGSATWTSPTDSNVIDIIWNGGWGDGTDGSTGFSSTVANVGANSSITYQMRSAATAGALTSASYQTLGTANSGTTFTRTKAQLDALSIPTGTAGRYIQVRATLASTDSVTNPQLDSFTIYYMSDDTNPESNASSVAMKKQAGGTDMVSNDWTNNSAPYFSWTAGSDSQAGLKGYCLYLGTDSNGDPATAKGLLGTSPVSTTGSTCQFIINATAIDFATVGYRGGTWITSSTSPYYLNVKAIDLADNIYATNDAQFQFRFDNTEPTNPAYISLPGDWISSKAVNITWATAGGDAASDDHSGVSGLQYRIGSSGTWYGDSHSGTEDSTDLLTDDGLYATADPPDYDDLTEGTNIVYFRTWDTAENVSTTYTNGTIKLNTVAPSVPLNLAVTPDTNTTNSYAFSWNTPTTYTGQASNITYCYTINTLPSALSCTYTSAGVTSLSADAFANQPGTNTLYMIAKDEADNLNYEVYASVEFEYSGTAPGIPRSADVADISIKATSNWKMAISWEEPSSVGAGIDSYKVYRSTTNTTCSANFSSFSELGTTAGTSYTDTGLDQQNYYYCLKACDSANNCSAASSTVSGYPDGKFTDAASLSSDPEVSDLTTQRATIKWSTDRDSDSKISYGKKSGDYYDEEPSNSDQTTSHEIKLTSLDPGTKYYYKARWTDEDGNTGESDEESFQTDPKPTISEAEAANIGISSATIKFTSENATKVKVYYGETTSFGGSNTIATGEDEGDHSTQLIGLRDGTKYYYQINTFDSEDDEYEGDINSFTTLPRPKISNVRIQQVKGTAQPTILVSWNTNTETSSIVTYYPETDPGQTRDEVNVNLTTGEHKMVVRSLFPNTRYSVIVKGRDKIGNEAVGDVQKIVTANDTRPPQISSLQVEGANVPENAGNSATTQIVVSWDTDEPATSQVEFGEGTGSSYSQKTQQDSNLTNNHLVIISNLTPSKVYHLKAVSNDEANNVSKSIDTVTITPKVTDSAFDLVIGNLKEVFGFLGRL